MGLLTYSLAFRGEASPDGDGLVVRASAPSCTLETRVAEDGVSSRQLFDEGVEEAILEALLAFRNDGSFTASTTIDFGHGHRLFIETLDEGRLDGSADEHLRHGTAVFRVSGGTGQFSGATGQVTSNFVLSDTGEVTDNQLGMVFLRPEVLARGS